MHTSQPTHTNQPLTEQRGDHDRGIDRSDRRESIVVPRESKPGVKTSEFWVMLAMVGATLLATYADVDSLARDDGWRFAALIVAAYIVSRGIAKIGTADRKITDRR